jgi:hypothetical protein
MTYKYPMIKIQPVPDKKGVRVLEDYPFEHAGITYKVEKGFVYNGANIPAPFWPIISSPFHYRIVSGAGVHDKIYGDAWIQIPRLDADQIMINIILDHGMGKLKAAAIKKALKLFGARNYEPRKVLDPKLQRVIDGLYD